MNKELVEIDVFSQIAVFKKDPEKALMHSLENSKNGIVGKHDLQREHRWLRKSEFENTAIGLKNKGLVEILREYGKRGRPSTFLRLKP